MADPGRLLPLPSTAKSHQKKDSGPSLSPSFDLENNTPNPPTPTHSRQRRRGSLRNPHLVPLSLARSLLTLSTTNKLVLVTLCLFLIKVLPLPFTPPIQLTHPIPALLSRAEKTHLARLASEPRTLEQAYARYLARHGRPPPKGYDAWYHFAVRHGACRIDGFDELYRSLRVWWGVEPAEIRARMNTLGGRGSASIGRVRVREGKVVRWGEMGEQGLRRGDESMEDQYARVAWEGMLSALVDEGVRLPDVDFFVNQLDEPRVIMPYEMRTALEQLGDKRKPRKPVTEDLVLHNINAPDPQPPIYSILRRACPPSSAARGAPLSPAPGTRPHVSQRYTSSFTTAPALGSFLVDPERERRTWCDQPDLQELHQTFIRPLSFSWTDQLFPVFSNSKIEGFNDILVPPWYWWDQKMPYREEEDVEWKGKANQMYWRGTNTGGRSLGLNWMGWLRSRLVSKLNRLVEWHHYDTVLLSSPLNRTLALELPSSAINSALTDVAFQAPDHHGDPASLESQRTEPSFRFVEGGRYTPFPTNYLFKLVLDLDGTAYSGRFPTLMASRSAVVRSALFTTVWDDTLVPWFHYLPLSLRLSETYNLVAYFLGVGSVPAAAVAQGFTAPSSPAELKALREGTAHEAELKRVAENGREWARSCARRENAMVYAYLVALEWARLTADGRDGAGWEMQL
ncbi:hypothetical protein JCM8097_000360 [Rhodosporidiobolus ruineniae]